MRIRVADIPMNIEVKDTAFFSRRFAAYRDDSDAPIQFSVTSTVTDTISPPAGEEYRTVRHMHLLRLPDGKLCYYTVAPSGKIEYLAQYTADYADIHMLISPCNPHFTETDYEYVYTGYEFSNRLGYLGGTVLHGSAIAYRGRGVIFSAPSGTGKSTHTGLWKGCFGEDVVFVNDDKPAIRFPNGEATVYGTPWSGKTDLNNNISAPLHAIVFVERGEQNAIRRLEFTESMFHLTEQTVRPYHDETLSTRLVDVMVQLAQTVPVYLLTCNMDPAAAVVARDGIFGK